MSRLQLFCVYNYVYSSVWLLNTMSTEQSLAKYVATYYVNEIQSHESPIRFQVTMDPETADNVIEFAQYADISRSGAICYLVEFALNHFEQQRTFKRVLESEMAQLNKGNNRGNFKDADGRVLSLEEAKKHVQELMEEAEY